MLKSLVTVAAVGAGVWAAFRAKGAHDMNVPWDYAFKYPFEDLAVLNRRIWDEAHPMPGAGQAVAQIIAGAVVPKLSTGNFVVTSRPSADSNAAMVQAFSRS